MEIRVTYLDIDWTNGSYETPISFPDPYSTLFKVIDKPNLVLENENIGTVILEGNYNYAFIYGNYYFLEKINTHDIVKEVHKYTMIRDMNYELYKLDNLVIEGAIDKTTDVDILEANIDKTIPLDIDLLHQEIIIPDKEFKGHGVKLPKLDFFNKPLWYITEESVTNFKQQAKKIPDGQERDYFSLPAYIRPVEGFNYKAEVIFAIARYYKEVEPIYNIFIMEDPKGPLDGLFQITRSKNSPWGTKYLKGIPLWDIDLTNCIDVRPINIGSVITPKVSKGLPDLTPVDYTNSWNIITDENREKLNEEYKKQWDKDITPDTFAVNLPKPNNIPEQAFKVIPYKNKYYLDNVPWNQLTEQQKLKAKDLTKDVYLYGLNSEKEFAYYSAERQVHSIDKSFGLNMTNLKANKSLLDLLDTKLKDLNKKKNLSQYLLHNVDSYRMLDFWSMFEYGKLFNDVNTEVVNGYRNVKTQYDLNLGIPRSGNDYDYNIFLSKDDWVKGKMLAFFTSYFFIRKGPYVMGFTDLEDRNSVYDDIINIVNMSTKSKPNVDNQDDINWMLNYIHKEYHKDFTPDIEPYYFHMKQDEFFNGEHWFDLVGTDYYFVFHNHGEYTYISLILKKTSDSLRSISYKLPISGNLDDISKDIVSRINSNVSLKIYNNYYSIIDKPVVKDDKWVIEQPISLVINGFFLYNPNELYHIHYSSKNSYIDDLITVPKNTAAFKLSQYSTIAHEDNLINYLRQKEDIEYKKQEIRLQREKEDFEYLLRREELAQQQVKSWVNTGIGALSAVVGIGGAITTGGFAGGLAAGGAIGTIQNISNTIFNQQDIRRSFRKLEEEERLLSQNRFLENARLDTQIHRLEYDRKLFLQRQNMSWNPTTVGNRDVYESSEIINFNKITDVKNDIVEVIYKRPNEKQYKELKAYYDRYGIDCLIENFKLVWKEYKDKVNIWRFKYIDRVNIKDPTVRGFIRAKFLNGVKLIKPNFT